jgi:hypothetical protein
MGICLEFVFLQIFKSRSGPGTEFNNNFSERWRLGTDFILQKLNWDVRFFLEAATSHGKFVGTSPTLRRGKSQCWSGKKEKEVPKSSVSSDP